MQMHVSPKIVCLAGLEISGTGRSRQETTHQCTVLHRKKLALIQKISQLCCRRKIPISGSLLCMPVINAWDVRCKSITKCIVKLSFHSRHSLYFIPTRESIPKTIISQSIFAARNYFYNTLFTAKIDQFSDARNAQNACTELQQLWASLVLPSFILHAGTWLIFHSKLERS